VAWWHGGMVAQWQQQLEEWAEMEQKDCCDFGAFENSHV